MKVYVQTDIEGVAGFCFFENRRSRDYEVINHRYRMYKLLTAEVNAAVKAAFDAGATEVVVNDSHGSGYNILFEDLDPRCRIIHGKNCSGPHWLPLLDSSFDAMVLIGMTFIAIGIFVSSLTENQFTASFATIGILLGLMIVAALNNIIDSYIVRSVLDWISIYSRYANFTYGIFDFGAVVYYISICVVFLFLTVRVFEKRRWS